MKNNLKILAFYLPQFHPFKENDEWWGKGFTEWRNVAKTSPRYKNHYQPHMPADLGFYDLRLEETREAQASLAKEYGLSGFCYYHYWFDGKIIMDRPFREVLKSGKPDFPFCLCWANENWTKAWDGDTKNVLISQNHCEEDDTKHIKWLIDAFKDERYIKVNGKPFVLIYRIDLLPDVKNTISIWREESKKAGFPDIHLVAVKSNFVTLDESEILPLGFDAVVEFQPNMRYFKQKFFNKAFGKIKREINNFYEKFISKSGDPIFRINRILDYKSIVNNSIKGLERKGRIYPCVFPSWDNSARRKDARIIENSDADLYGYWLEKTISSVKQRFSDTEEQFVFINAWNEWAEGCHLEPDLKHGLSFLEATKKVLKK